MKVKNILSLTNSGLKDWLWQRISAVVLLAYAVYVCWFWQFTHLHSSQAIWRSMLHPMWMKCFSIIALVALLLHAWVGLWVVFTDYVKAKWLRVVLQSGVIFLLLGYIAWGLFILSKV